MNNRAMQLIIAAFLALAFTTSAQDVVKVSIYYSTHSQNSMAFITAKFSPFWDSLGEFIDLDMVPYGNSTHTRVSEDEEWVFSCENGPEECVANMWHACVVFNYQPVLPEALVSFANCSLFREDPLVDSEKCITELNLDAEVLNACMKVQAAELLVFYGNRTHEHVPKFPAFPSIVFNDEYHQEEQDSAVLDFKKTLCTYLEVNGTRPDACNGTSLPQVSTLISLLVLTLLALLK